jgi:hypothetical protein
VLIRNPDTAALLGHIQQATGRQLKQELFLSGEFASVGYNSILITGSSSIELFFFFPFPKTV